MKNILDRYVNRYERKHKDFRRYAAIVAVLALVVFVGVNWRLHDKGISMTSDYQCGLKEHKHTEKCYKKVLICGKEETDGSEGHTHTASCYKEEQKLTCDKEEHKHTADCYDEEGNLICDKEEHTHSKDCYTTEKKLVCGKEESKPVKAHHHTDACYKKELVCKLKEHTHTAACYSNESADVETESDWKATIPTLSGNWAEDIVSVAQSQLGYEESTANFKLADDGKTRNGYTRYGDWYGNKYGDWSAMFASFCLNYAGIPSKTVPVNSGSIAWITELKQKNLYKAADNAGGDYNPTTGDLVFLDTDNDGKADHVGIITETETKDNKADSKVTSLKAIVGDLGDKVEEKTYKTGSDVIVGYCALPENPDGEKTTEEAEKVSGEKTATTEKTNDVKAEDKTEAAQSTTAVNTDKNSGKKSKKSAKSSDNAVAVQSADGVAVQAESANRGLDLSDNITDVILEKKDGIIWIPTESFDSNDQARAEIIFKNLKKSDLQDNNYKAYIPLSKGLDCSKFNDTYSLYDGTKKSGEYRYKQADDGSWYIEIDFDKDYVDDAGTNINGQINLSYEWNKDEIADSGKKTEVVIGSWSSQVEVKKDDTKKDDSETNSDNFSLSKKSSELGYDKNGAYIDYTVTLDVKKDVSGPILLDDVLTSKLFTFEGSPSITPANYNVAFKDTKSTDNGQSTTIVVGSENTTIAKGKYEITYRVRTNASSNVSIDEKIKNSVTITDDGKKYPAEIEKELKSNPVTKGGTLVEEDGVYYIDWTVYINAGTYIQDLKEAVNFSDTIEEGQELIGDVNVIKYNPDATIAQDGIKGKYDSANKKITYTTDTGRYYYEIKYRTKVTKDIGIGSSTTISNTGKVDGGMNGESKGDVTVDNHVLSKSAGSPFLKTDADGKWIAVIPWTSKIDTENLSNYIYTDWAENSQTTMTEEQFNAIKIYDATEGVVSSDQYTISRFSKKDSQGNETGLFQINFKENCNVKGPVTIKYATTTDLSGFTEGAYPTITNYAAVEWNGQRDETSAKRQFHYEKSNISKILKYNDVEDTSGSGSMTLKPGEDTIPWTIRLNTDSEKMEGDLTVVDTIPDGLILDESSIQVVGYGDGPLKYTKEIVKNADGTTSLTIKIRDQDYVINGARQVIRIKYNTKIDPESDFYKGAEISKKFTNTATVTNKDGSASSTREETVTRTVVQKSGSYDEPNHLLTYEITINPDGAKLLKSGDTLTVTDKLDDSTLSKAGKARLTSLKLFTAISKKEDGKTVLKPGTLVKELNQVDQDSKELYTYIYDSSTNEFKAYIPDGEAYVMVATYAVELNADLNADVQMKNEVTVSGENQESWSNKDEKTDVKKDTSGHTWTGDNITIIKHDISDYDTKLEGAVFSLYKYDNNKWILVSDRLQTDNNGNISQSIMNEDGTNNRDILYKLVETEAPSGYVVDSTPYYFMITEKDNYNLPDSISGNEDIDYSKEKVHVTKVSSDNTAANVIIDRYNAQDTTTVKPGQLRVNKKWINGSGEEVTDLLELAKMSSVEVTLTKHVRASGNKITFQYNSNNGVLSKVVSDVNPGASLYIASRQDLTTQMQLPEGLSITNTGKYDSGWRTIYLLEGITDKDVIIEVTQNAFYNTDWDNITKEGGTAPAGVTSTVIGKKYLENSNKWSCLWNDLEIDDKIQYTLTETTVDGYTATYELNGEDLVSGEAFKPNANGDIVTITNKAKESYTLPETGGIGTLPFITIGASLMGFALLCGYSMRRRRESERRVE